MTISHAIPVLGVRDVASAAAFVRDRLGFTLLGMHGEPPGFAILERDGVELFLQTNCNLSLEGEAPVGDESWSAYLGCSDVEALHADLTERGAPILRGPVDKEYGQREFEVAGPEHHILVFAQSHN